MSIPTLPLVERTNPTPLILCAQCPTDVPATRQVNYLVDPGTRDERPEYLAICDHPACYAAACDDISFVGDLRTDDPITTLDQRGNPDITPFGCYPDPTQPIKEIHSLGPSNLSHVSRWGVCRTCGRQIPVNPGQSVYRCPVASKAA